MSIVRMKRLKLLVLAQERDALLSRLLHMGCVEVSEPERELSDPEWSALLSRDSSSLGEVKANVSGVGAALDALKKYAPVKAPLLHLRTSITEKDFFNPEKAEKALQDAEAINAAVSSITQLNTRESRLLAKKDSLSPWKTLDLPLEVVSTATVDIIPGTLPATADSSAIRGELAEHAPLSELTEISADAAARYVLLICFRESWPDAQETLKPHSFSAVRFKDVTGTAAENIAALDCEIAQISADREAEIKVIQSHADCRDALQVMTDRLNQDAMKEAARERGLTDGTIVFLEGWIPTERVDGLKQELSGFVCAYDLSDPSKEDETPPTLLKNPKWMQPMNMVTEMYSLPAYDGLDPNPLMFPFFVLFYGIMMADMGYGLLMMIAALVVKKKANPKGTMGQLFGLMGLCGTTTFLFGALTGGFFGDFLTQISLLINPNSTFALPYLFTPLNDTMTILVGAMILGAIQVITGMAINFYKLTRRGQFWDAVMDVGSWWLVFIGVGVGIAAGFWWVAIAGVVALIATQGRHSPTILGKLVGGISSLYDITGYFGDILSYSRLMALMLAGSVIAQVFNTLGAIPGNIIIFIIISMVGNTLNFGLNLLGCYVHDLRLQCLEYFNKFYEDGGRPFRPLSYDTTKYVDVIEK